MVPFQKKKKKSKQSPFFSLVNACLVAKYNFISFAQYCQYNLDYTYNKYKFKKFQSKYFNQDFIIQ